MSKDTAIRHVIEAALLCAEQPLGLTEIARLFEDETVSREDIRRYLAELQLDWAERGLELAQLAQGWRFRSRPHMQPYLARLQLERRARYSRAVLETLAIIVWRQPVTRGDIEGIRGVTVSTSTIRTLEERAWIRTVGQRDAPGRPALYASTPQLLSDLGVRSLDELVTLFNDSMPLSPDDLTTLEAAVGGEWAQND